MRTPLGQAFGLSAGERGQEPAALFSQWPPAFSVFGIALLVRTLALPLAAFDDADAATRIWIGWSWLEHPTFMPSTVWGPLHFYLIGLMLRAWPDPVWAPAVLHVIIGALVAPVVYQLTLEIFGWGRAALLTGLAFALYPAAVASSLFALSETPFMLFLALGLLFLVRAHRPTGTVRDAILAGIAIGLSSMVRFESWLLLPFLTLPLIRRPKLLTAFLVPALVHPVIWMIASAVVSHDPLHSFTWASHWERDVNGRAQLVSLAWSARQIWNFLRATQAGLSPPLCLLIAFGVIWCLWRHRAQAIWLVPPLMLLGMLVGAAARGSLAVKWRYTVTLGMMFFPFAACSFRAMGSEGWSRRRLAGATVALLAGISVFTIEPLWRAIPHGEAVLARTRMTPSFPDFPEARDVLSLVNRGQTPGHEALLSDFYGWQPTFYVGLHTKLHPDHIFIVYGAPNESINVASIESFLARNRQGVLLTADQGRLGSLVQSEGDHTVRIGGARLRLESAGEVRWPFSNNTSPVVVHAARYAVLGSSLPP